MMGFSQLKALRLAVIGACLFAASCAVDGGVADRDGHGAPASGASAARLGLAPALRPFYDELEPYGDWVLVEPQGWVFRPRVNTVAWRPYQDGQWEPSYVFGWVWESNDPFGWITDHYGFWFHDDFQGWLWQPYGAWAPSWVAWVQVGDFVGWAPLAPSGAASYTDVPGGVFTYVSAQTLSQPNASMHASFVGNVPDDGSEMQPIERVASYRGVHWNAGPDPDEILGPAAADRLKLEERDRPIESFAPARQPVSTARALELGVLEERTRRIWTEARRELAVVRRARGVAVPDSAAVKSRSPAPQRSEMKPRPLRRPAFGDSAGVAPGDSLRPRRSGWPPGSGN